MKLYALLFALCYSLISFSQNAFEAGEKLKYDVYYKVAFIWIDAAYVNLEVNEVRHQNQPCFEFKSTGSSKPNYDWIFRVRDYFTSIVDQQSLVPLQFYRNTSEGDYKVNNQYIFDHEMGKVYGTIQRNQKKTILDTLSFTPPMYDIISTAYQLRNMDFNQMNKGDSIHIRALVDNEIFDTDILYLGEEWVTHKNKKKYPAYKFRSKGLEGSMFDENDFITVWVSKDKHKIPIKVEAGIVVGKVLVYLNSAEIPNELPYGLLKEF